MDATDCVAPAPAKPIPFEEIGKAPLLFLIIQDSTGLVRGTTFNINACGLQGSARGGSDGFVYLGTDPTNDIVMPKEETGIGERHLAIKYGIEAKCYYIKDLGEGTGTFIKIESPLELQHGYILSFSDTHLVVHMKIEGKIQLRFLDGPKSDQTLYDFWLRENKKTQNHGSTFDKEDRVIRIGRMSDCDIKFDDTSLSRYQCTYHFFGGRWFLEKIQKKYRLYYKENQWVVEDGYNGKGSTNGTWLFVDEFFKIYDGMVFKAGQTLFNILLKSLGDH